MLPGAVTNDSVLSARGENLGTMVRGPESRRDRPAVHEARSPDRLPLTPAGRRSTTDLTPAGAPTAGATRRGGGAAPFRGPPRGPRTTPRERDSGRPSSFQAGLTGSAELPEDRGSDVHDERLLDLGPRPGPEPITNEVISSGVWLRWVTSDGLVERRCPWSVVTRIVQLSKG